MVGDCGFVVDLYDGDTTRRVGGIVALVLDDEQQLATWHVTAKVAWPRRYQIPVLAQA